MFSFCRCIGVDSGRQHVDWLRFQHKIVTEEYFPLLSGRLFNQPCTSCCFDFVFYISARVVISVCYGGCTRAARVIVSALTMRDNFNQNS